MGCAHWTTAGELARIFLIGREQRQVLANSAQVRADTHAGHGVGVRKRGEGMLLWLLLI